MKFSHSKIKICKVLTLSDWGQDPYTEKMFPYSYIPNTFSYDDYRDAWYNILYYSNMSHSWFIHFSHTCHGPFPAWFLRWWEIVGPIIDILPSEILQRYNYFLQHVPTAKNLLQYFSF